MYRTKKQRQPDILVVKIRSGKTTPDWRERFNRVYAIQTVLEDLFGIVLSKAKYMFTAVEGYSYNSGAGAFYTLAEVKQAILMAYHKYDSNMYALLILAPMTWKNIMGMMPPKALAATMTQSQKKRWGMDALCDRDNRTAEFGTDHNSYDAYALAASYRQFVCGGPNNATIALRKREAVLYNSIEEALKLK